MAQQLQQLTHVQRDKEREVEPEKRPLDWGLIRRMLTYTRAHAVKRNWLLLIVTVRSIQLPILAWLTGQIIQGPIAGGDWKKTIWYSGIFLALAMFTYGMMYFRMRLSLELGESAVHDMRRDLFRHLHRMPMSFFHEMRLGRLISRMTSDIEVVRVGIQEVLFVAIVNFGQMFVAAGLMLWIDPVLFVIVLGLAPILWLVNRTFAVRLSQSHRAVQESYSRVSATLAESVIGIRVTQGFVRQDLNAELFHTLVDDHAAHNVASSRTNAIFAPLLELNTQFFLAVLLLIGGYRVFAFDAPVGDLVVFFFLANVFFGPVRVLGTEYNNALNSMAGAERVFKLLDTKPAWTEPDDVIDPGRIHGRVEFKNLSFAYVPGKTVLSDVNFIAEPGQTIALVGHTGSGKSSIINLISKFYLPTEGELLIDGLDVRKIKGDCLHKQLGIVLQANFLFTGTVMDNIKVGKEGATDQEVIDAARALDCLDLLEALPQGMHTPVGERGGSISIGQRQIICFTRAMLADPRILILDEATSSVDTITEARIQHALSLLLRNRTSFAVAHRLSTIRHADVVLVLDHGKIIERGSHTELLIRAGVYANLYRQFIRATEA